MNVVFLGENKFEIVNGTMPKFDRIWEFNIYDNAIFKLKDKYGVINRCGKCICEAIYNKICFVSNGCIVCLAKDDTYYIFDKEGYIIQNSKFCSLEEAKMYANFFVN